MCVVENGSVYSLDGIGVGELSGSTAHGMASEPHMLVTQVTQRNQGEVRIPESSCNITSSRAPSPGCTLISLSSV